MSPELLLRVVGAELRASGLPGVDPAYVEDFVLRNAGAFRKGAGPS